MQTASMSSVTVHCAAGRRASRRAAQVRHLPARPVLAHRSAWRLCAASAHAATPAYVSGTGVGGVSVLAPPFRR